MIALLNDGGHFIDGCENINQLLIDYVEYVGFVDKKVFSILVDSNKMSTKELVEYINDNVYSSTDKIIEIYEIGKKIY